VLFALGVVLVVVLYCRSAYGDTTAALAAMTIATCPLVVIFARTVIIDMLLAFFVVSAILCGAVAIARAGPSRARWLALGAACAGAATLTKGPVGAIVPALVLSAYFWSLGELRAARLMFHPRNLLIFAAIVAPWFVGVVLRRPDFLRYGLLMESIERFTSPV